MFQLEYIPWAVLVRSGRDVVGFKILIMGFSANWKTSGMLVRKATTYLTIIICRSNGHKRRMAHTIITNLVLCRSTSKMLVHCTEHQYAFFTKHLL